MPRKGVPYGGAICSLRERIAELFDLVGEKLHSINGVQGDGQGNVKIVSGNPAVVITNDAAQNEIEIALDKSKLPSAMVTSVNGESGPVFLKARDIPSDGHSNVQDDIDSSRTSITALAGDIIIERQMRQKTDAALQTNINRVQASMPGAAAAAVSNNPTVARLASDVPNKLDRITSGSSLKAYTHTGATQGETSVVDGTAANSIGIRDANGRMRAADPAAGATDKTLVTANWVSQTGDSAPNNLAHKNGSETIDGDKRFTSLLIGRGNAQYYSNFWLQNMSIDRSVYDNTRREIQISFRDMNSMPLGGLILVRKTASTEIIARIFRQDGTYLDKTLISVTETP